MIFQVKFLKYSYKTIVAFCIIGIIAGYSVRSGLLLEDDVLSLRGVVTLSLVLILNAVISSLKGDYFYNLLAGKQKAEYAISLVYFRAILVVSYFVAILIISGVSFSYILEYLISSLNMVTIYFLYRLWILNTTFHYKLIPSKIGLFLFWVVLAIIDYFVAEIPDSSIFYYSSLVVFVALSIYVHSVFKNKIVEMSSWEELHCAK